MPSQQRGERGELALVQRGKTEREVDMVNYVRHKAWREVKRWVVIVL